VLSKYGLKGKAAVCLNGDKKRCSGFNATDTIEQINLEYLLLFLCGRCLPY
jgi:hypothetical protein